MRIDFKGRLVDEPQVRAGFIGCGSHSFRNLFPTFQFAPVQLAATCDLSLEKARAFAAKFGALAAYGDHRRMIEKEKLDCVFICTGYDAAGRPTYPKLAIDCLDAGLHVWIEKPPAASCREIEEMQKHAAAAGRNVMVGLKKMFFPANEKARRLMDEEDFGRPSLAMMQYPQYVPTQEEFDRYRKGDNVGSVTGFLDHLCHPASVMLLFLGMPRGLYYRRSDCGSGLAVFTFASGAAASLALTHGSSCAGGMERTTIVSDKGRHIVVENNIRVSYCRGGLPGYGDRPDFYTSSADQTTAHWEPEFSLGQLYNKGLFLLGYYGEVNEFARSILDRRPVAKASLEHAWQVTRIFEAFTSGEGRNIELD
jgi:predicted dehydrogenase